MNALSWMIYLAEVSDSVRWFVWFGTIGAVIISVFFLIAAFACMSSAEERRTSANDKDDWHMWAKKWVSLLKTSVPIFVVCFLVASFLPSKQTIMLIAASQVGEQVLNTDAAKEVGGIGLDTLHNLNDYLKSLVPKPVETK